MTTTIIIISVLAVLGWIVFRRKSSGEVDSSGFPSTSVKESPDNLSEPIITYSLYVIDTRLNRRLEMQSPKEFSNQYGILNGQTFELHWNVLNADWIRIEGVGFVQAIGKKEFYPAKNTKYIITAKNRNHSTEQIFFVRVFPLPVMEKLMVPMPEISTNNIELFKTEIPTIKRLDAINFPSLQIPSVIQIRKDNTAVKPPVILLDDMMLKRVQHDRDMKHAEQYTSFKTKLFDRMENNFKDNYKIRDIIQTIRKHYG